MLLKRIITASVLAFPDCTGSVKFRRYIFFIVDRLIALLLHGMESTCRFFAG